MLRPQDKRTGFKQGNRLKKHSEKNGQIKTFSFASGATTTATRVVVKANELNQKTAIHPLNPRRQESLTLDSVRDILPSIKLEGVHTEGVATKDSHGNYLLLDSSRRHFACVHTEKDLPLWVLEDDICDSDLVAFIETTQSVKRLSYRELGANYASIMKEHKFKKIEQLAEHLNIGRETCRKRYVAASITQSLIDVFPDCEGIPNTFYSKISNIEKQLAKQNVPIFKFIQSLDVQSIPYEGVEIQQKKILNLMESKLQSKDKTSNWNTQSIATFSDKNQYAKVSRSNDNRGLKIELSRLSPDLYDEIVQFVTDKVNN